MCRPQPSTGLSSCGNISYSGDYALTGDVGNSDTCFTIETENVTLDCAGHSISGLSGSGYGVNNTGHNYVTVKNCNIAGFGNGIDFESTSYGTIINNTASLNSNDGIELDSGSGTDNIIANNTASSNGNYGISLGGGSSGNIVTDNTADSNTYGIVFDSSSNSTATNNTANSNSQYGIYLTSSSNIIVSNNIAGSNGVLGIYVESSSNNTVSNNTLSSNTNGLDLQSSSDNTVANNTASGNGAGFLIFSSFNLIYNNFLNNTNNAMNTGSNFWNTTLDCSQGVANIINGPCIGGNYWAQPDGNGWSQNSSECIANESGICTANYTIPGTSDADYLPLTNLTAPPPIGLSDCGNISYSGSYVLTGGSYGYGYGGLYGNDCFDIQASNVVLDCNGSTITGPFSQSGTGIYNNGYNYTTVKNCIVTGFYNGIDFENGASYGTITNNTANSNFNYGIYLSSGFTNTIANNTANYEGGNWDSTGIWLSSSSNSTIANNNASYNGWGGIVLSPGSNNTIANNTVISDNVWGIRITGSSGNTVYNNYFSNSGPGANNAYDDGTNNWNTTLTYDPANPNIIGGNWTGGNFWSGFSDNSSACTDPENGICNNTQYNITGSSDVDHLPLTNLTAPPPIGLSDCGNISYSGSYVLTGGSYGYGYGGLYGNDCFDIQASNVVLDCNGSTITGPFSQSGTGIYNNGYNYTTVKNCIVTGFYNGIDFEGGVSNGTIVNNTVSSNSLAGIYMNAPTTTMIVGTAGTATVSCPAGGTISSYSSLYAVNCNPTPCGSCSIGATSCSVTIGNSQCGDPCGGVNKFGNLSITCSGAPPASSATGTNNTISGNTASSNGYAGIFLGSNSTVINNNVSSNIGDGIYLSYGSSYDTIANNIVINNSAGNWINSGIFLMSSSNNDIYNNTISGNGYYGIWLNFGSNYNTLANNNASNNTGSSGSGIYFLWGDNNNTVFNNTANSNSYGIFFNSDGGGNILYNNITANTVCSNAQNDIYLAQRTNGNSGDNTCGVPPTSPGLIDWDSNSVRCLTHCPG